MSQIIHPSSVRYDEIDLSWMIGRTITQVCFLEPTLWRFFFGSPEYVAAECLWRIVSGDRVVRTSGDHGQRFGLPALVDAAQQATTLLSGAPTISVHLRKTTADICIELSRNLRLEIIPDSSGYESWQICAPAGVWFVAQGGGQICTWTQ